MKRPESLARFLDAARDALSARVQDRTPPAAAASRVFEALAASVGAIAPGTLDPPPAYRHLPWALQRARTAPELSRLVEAFEVLEPELRWRRRPGSESHGTEFHDGHANADIIGPMGLERRSDVWFGATLVAPDVRYIDHRHPPEEVYIVLSEGEWYREGCGWHAPGVGGTVYNPPNVVHAMRAGPAALLALWLLPSDPPG